MTTELAIQDVRPPEMLKLTAAEIRADVNLIQQVLRAVMKKDVHYGIIPGTPKPTLYKPGAEKIMVTFRLNGEPLIEDLSSDDEIRYRVRVRVTHQVTRQEIGWGVGECSSNETKYKWIKVKFPTEWDTTPENQRRVIWKQGNDKPYEVKQVMANIADVANTVLKMAKKRALVDATLTCTGASDVFDQDIEDMPEGIRANVAEAARAPMPQRASEKPPATEEEPPPAKKVNLAGARTMAAKFNAPCKTCGGLIDVGEDMLYVGEGPDKGRYHVSHKSA